MSYFSHLQMTRQKNSLAEELVNARRECERTNETCVRIAKEKENLTKEKAQLIVDLTAAERENRAQSEVRYGLIPYRMKIYEEIY